MNDKTTTPEATTEAPAARGRGPNPENVQRLEHIVTRAKQEPGVTSPTIAKELGISTLSCGQLADRLVRKGDIQLHKMLSGMRTYYPAGYDMSTIPAEEPKPKPEKPAKAAPVAEADPAEEAAPEADEDLGEGDGL